MAEFLKFLQDYWVGILVFLICFFCVLKGVDYLARIFAVGRYKEIQHSKKDGIAFVIADFFAKIIDDFRHLLAVLIVSIFALTLVYSIVFAADTFEEKMDALQSVVAVLGGLVGSVIGYYFGEAKGRNSNKGNPNNETNFEEGEGDETEEVIAEVEPPEGME